MKNPFILHYLSSIYILFITHRIRTGGIVLFIAGDITRLHWYVPSNPISAALQFLIRNA
ncbi:hypothetical protein [Chitinophaga pinensis]|uniref:hypothetical protein n=1 Tax=Chitinophaga pinensis TaxID=79329 RepID=UPI0016488620|nr:hypothetical protein [Chitinophaga pinensis]